MVDSSNVNEVNEVELQEEKKEQMNIQVEITQTSTCERHIKVTVARDEVDRYFDKECVELQKTITLPGFRVGKAPRRLVEKRCKEDILARVKSNLLLDSLTQANETENLTPISEPDFDVKAINIPTEGPFVYEYDIEVRPEFDVPNWKGLRLEKFVRQFTPEDVDAAIGRVCERYAQLVPSLEPAKIDDYIECKLTFKNEGVEISSSPSETIQIRSTLTFHDSTIKDFDQHMAGAKAGDTITIPTVLTIDTPNAFLSGKTIDAVFEIKQVLVPEIPKPTLNFFQSIGDFETEADFRDMVLDMLERQLSHTQSQQFRKQICDVLTAHADWQLPPGLLQRQSSREIQRAVMEMRRNGLAEDRIRAQVNYIYQNIQKTTAQALKEHFIFERIAEIESVDASEIDYDIEVSLIAAQMDESPRRIRAQLEKAGEMDILRNQIIERKVINLIQAEATIVDVPYVPEFLAKEEMEAVDLAAATAPAEEIPTMTAEEAKEEAKEIVREGGNKQPTPVARAQ